MKKDEFVNIRIRKGIHKELKRLAYTKEDTIQNILEALLLKVLKNLK